MSVVRRYPELTESARDLIEVYDQTPGASGPYANPTSLGNVLSYCQRLSQEQLAQLIHDLSV